MIIVNSVQTTQVSTTDDIWVTRNGGIGYSGLSGAIKATGSSQNILIEGTVFASTTNAIWLTDSTSTYQAITIAATGVLQSGSDAIYAAGELISLDNHGIVTGEISGLLANGDASVLNTGALSAGYYAIWADHGTITNSGTISSELISTDVGYATIFLTDDTGSSTITNSGNIFGSDTTIIAGHNLYIHNLVDGVIQSNEVMGASTTADLYVENSGQISGKDIALIADGIAGISNSGEINSLNRSAISASSGTIINSGTISNGAWSTFVNTPTISLYSATGTSTITNSGDIIADDLTISVLHDLYLDNAETGSIQSGRTAAYSESDLYAQNAGDIIGRDFGLYADGNLELTNSGQIRSEFNDVLSANFRNDNTILADIFNLADGLISSTNEDLISMGGGTLNLVNQGNLFAGSDLIAKTYAGEVTFSNSGTANAETLLNLTGTHSVNLTNSGEIDLSGAFRSGTSQFDLVLDNSGTISTASGWGTTSGGALDIINTGDISASNGVLFKGSGIGINNAGEILLSTALLSTDGNAAIINSGDISSSTYDSEQIGLGLVVDNSGTMRMGGFQLNGDLAGAYFSNSGSMSFANYILAAQGSSRILNSGDISGYYGFFGGETGDFRMRNSGSITVEDSAVIDTGGAIILHNAEGATISGLEQDTFASFPSNEFRLFDGATLFVRNQGSIISGESAFAVSQSAQIFNSGEITTLSDMAVLADFTSGVIKNSGVIQAGGALATVSGYSVKVSNTATGQMDLQKGLVMLEGGYANITNGGSIVTTESLISGFADYGFSQLSNTGSIQSGSSLISQGNFSSVNMTNSGVISAAGYVISGGQDDENTVLNTGSISASDGFYVSNLSLKNSGDITIENSLLSPFNGVSLTGFELRNSGSLTVAGIGSVDGGFFSNTGVVTAGDGLTITDALNEDPFSFSFRFDNSGLISVDSGTVLTSNSSKFIAVTNQGEMFGSTGVLNMTGDIYLNNAGKITSNGVAIELTDGSGSASISRIINTGEILAGDRAILATDMQGASVLINSGEIAGNGTYTLQYANAGGNSGFGHTIINSGQILGNIYLSQGGDTYDGRGGFVSGFVDGGAGDDILTGGETADVLIGGSGANTLRGLGGDDTLTTGDNNDFISGGAGDDIIVSGNGDDIIRGGDGDDDINGQGGIDNIKGGNGNDYIRMGNGDGQRGEGNAGDDILIGGNQKDVLLGGANEDELIGNAGDDVLRGGIGDDILEGGQGNDRLVGDAGIDTAVFSGDLADYVFTLNANGTVSVQDTAGTDGTDNLFGVEFVEFSDGTYLLSDFI